MTRIKCESCKVTFASRNSWYYKHRIRRHAGVEPDWQTHAHSSRAQEVHMSTDQGMDGTPYLTYYDKTHSLSFSWDGTVGEWIDVSYGGAGEPVFARITYPAARINPYGPEAMMASFKGACDSFITLIHEIEHTTIGHEHDNVGILE